MGWRTAHLTALAVVYLVYVTPSDRPDMAVRIDDTPKFIGVGEADAVEPAAVHADRVMMQTYHGGCGRIGQCPVESFELLRRQAAADLARVIAVQHYKLPAALQVRAADLKRRLCEFPAHGVRLVVTFPECIAPAFADRRGCCESVDSRKDRPGRYHRSRAPPHSPELVRMRRRAPCANSRRLARRAACRLRCRTNADR